MTSSFVSSPSKMSRPYCRQPVSSGSHVFLVGRANGSRARAMALRIPPRALPHTTHQFELQGIPEVRLNGLLERTLPVSGIGIRRGELIQEGCELFLGIHDARSDPRDPVRSTGSRSVAASVTGPPSIDGSIRGSVVDVVDTAADPKGRTY